MLDSGCANISHGGSVYLFVENGIKHTGTVIYCGIPPKATVQAAIGGIPLSLGMDAGNIILTVAVLAIMITAPLGAIGMDLTDQRLLKRGTQDNCVDK